MYRIYISLLLSVLSMLSFGQSDFIQIDSPKPLAVFSFLETASNQRAISLSYQDYIMEHLGDNEEFINIVNDYSAIEIEYSIEYNQYPDNRPAYRNTKDLIWGAASSTSSLAAFSDAIIGILPHFDHVALMDAMVQAEPYYDELIGNPQSEQVAAFIKDLSKYKTQIEDAYLEIAEFYGTDWDRSIPFKVVFYPIPLEHGMTSAIPKGNNLICNFLSLNDQSYKSVLGVLIHEMCHILYYEQSVDLQHQLDRFWTQSESPYAKLAYSYADEGLATALGNGWAYEFINGEIDTFQWYNDPYINGFGHELYHEAKSYIDLDKSMDQDFIDAAIKLFADRFPKAIYDKNVLLNEVVLIANSEDSEKLDSIVDTYRSKFRTRSMWFYTPIQQENPQESILKKGVSKFIIVERDHDQSLELLRTHFEQIPQEVPMNSIFTFEDTATQCIVFLLVIDGLSHLSDTIDKVAEDPYVVPNQLVRTY